VKQLFLSHGLVLSTLAIFLGGLTSLREADAQVIPACRSVIPIHKSVATLL
jgi:hypothetical protein